MGQLLPEPHAILQQPDVVPLAVASGVWSIRANSAGMYASRARGMADALQRQSVGRLSGHVWPRSRA